MKERGIFDGKFDLSKTPFDWALVAPGPAPSRRVRWHEMGAFGLFVDVCV